MFFTDEAATEMSCGGSVKVTPSCQCVSGVERRPRAAAAAAVAGCQHYALSRINRVTDKQRKRTYRIGLNLFNK